MPPPAHTYPLVGLVWYADFDPTTAGGVAAPLFQFLIETDNASLWYKSGPSNTDWTQLSGGGGGGGPSTVGIQSYRYVATGAENPAGFPIPLQTMLTDVLYNATVTLADTTEDYTTECPPSGYGLNQFICVPGAQPIAGDIMIILIMPLT